MATTTPNMFRKDIFEQENSFFFKNCMIIPRYLQMKYKFPLHQEVEFIDELQAQKDLSIRNVGQVNEIGLTEKFMRNCFKKCKQFVLEDWIDYDEIDCTMKCALVHKKSFELLQNALTKDNLV